MHKAGLQKVVLNISFYREGKKFIAYSPALNLSTCGDSLVQARKRFDELARLFLEEAVEMGTFEDILLECGWKRVLRPQKCWQPPLCIGQEQEEIKIPCPA